jgi:signal transduction histidine kinase
MYDSPENIDRVFAPFYTTNPQGMGLAICRSIIEAQGGRFGRSRTRTEA